MDNFYNDFSVYNKITTEEIFTSQSLAEEQSLFTSEEIINTFQDANYEDYVNHQNLPNDYYNIKESDSYENNNNIQLNQNNQDTKNQSNADQSSLNNLTSQLKINDIIVIENNPLAGNKVMNKNFMRMTCRDSIHKKIKGKFFKFLISIIKLNIKDDIQIKKISSKMINNVSYEFNKDLFQKTLQKVFYENSLVFRDDKDIRLATKSDECFNRLKLMLKSTLAELFQYYLQKCIDFDIEAIKKFEMEKKGMNEENCKKYLTIYKNMAENLISYFS